MHSTPTSSVSRVFPGRMFSRASAALVTFALTGAMLTACGDDSPSGPHDNATAWTAPGSNVDLMVADSLPGEDPGENFAERVWYPVRDGDADPSQNWADVYLPEGDFEPNSVPLVILIHGGAWHGGAPGVRNMAQDLSDRGIAVYNLEYRDIDKGGGYPKTFTDVADALDIVPELNHRFPEISIDDETVVGHSAGAQLAAWAGTRSDLEEYEVGANPLFTPTRVVSLAGPLDLVWAAENGDNNIVKAMKGTPTDFPEEYASVDPIQNINPDIPVVAVHGTEDDLVPPQNSENYVATVTDENGDAHLVLLDGESHATFMSASSDHYEQVLDLIHHVAVAPRSDLKDDLNGGTSSVHHFLKR